MTHSGDILIGRKADGTKVYVEARLARTGDTAREWGRTDHQGTVTNPLRLSITGVTTNWNGSVEMGGTWQSCGQVRDDLLEIARLESGWTVADVIRLHEIWNAWHLNDTQAGCDHQPPESVVYEDSEYGKRVDLDATPRCPETGYKWGSAWLYRALPADVVEWISERFEIDSY